MFKKSNYKKQILKQHNIQFKNDFIIYRYTDVG